MGTVKIIWWLCAFNALFWFVIGYGKDDHTQELVSTGISMMFVCTSFIMVGIEQVLKAVQKK